MPIRNSREASRIAEASTSEILRQERIMDYGFNSAGGTSLDTLNQFSNSTTIREMNWLWMKNPLANSIVELQLDFILGDGITFTAKNKLIQQILEEYWNDSDNDWDNKGSDRFRDLSLNGELIIKPVVKRPSGRVKISTVFPDIIVGIERDWTRENITAVKTNIQDHETLQIIKWDETEKSFVGDIFLYQINKPTFASRGLSDLFVTSDWLKQYDKTLYTTMERVGNILSFVWDIVVKGADEKTLRDRYRQILRNPPTPGSIQIHNESESWSQQTPQLGGRDVEDVFRLLKSQIIGGSRQPEHYFGMGGDVNLATAGEMKKPYFMKVKKRQKLIKKILTDQFKYVIWAARTESVVLRSLPVEDLEFKIVIPDPDKDQAMALSDTVLKFSNALAVLETAGYIDKKTANAVVKMLLGQLGVDVTNNIESDKLYDAAAMAAKATLSQNNKIPEKAVV